MSGVAAVAGPLAATIAFAPASAMAQAPSPDPDAQAADTRPPRLMRVALGPKVAKARTGTVLRFELDEAARVAGVVTMRRRGVRTRGRRCVLRTRKRRGPSCTLRTRAGKLLAAQAASGRNRARLNLRRLRPGAYTLTLTPTDAAGNVGAGKAVAFRVRKP